MYKPSDKSSYLSKTSVMLGERMSNDILSISLEQSFYILIMLSRCVYLHL